jgi:teichuronic acid exporter
VSGNLKTRALNAVIWSAAERMSSQMIRFVIGIVLARLLEPAEFGLIGMLAVFLSVSNVFVNCGFGEALIQKQNVTRQDESSVFYFNLILGFLAAITLYLGAPVIARFYAQPALVWLARIMAVDVMINSFGIVQTMLLTKRIDFKTQIQVSLTSTAISGAIAIWMAFQGFGVLSLAAQMVLADLFRTLLLWLCFDWRPLLSFSLASLKDMFPYGSRLFASAVLNSIFVEAYTVIIGRLYPATVLGFYTRARQIQQLPVDALGSIVNRVSFPVFSAVQSDKPKLKRGVRRAVKGLAWLNFPIMVGLGVIAKPLVIALLTEKWVGCIPLIQLLCIQGAVFPLSLIHVSALAAQGKSDIFLRLEIYKKVLTILGVAATFKFGVVGLLIGGVLVGIISYLLNAYYSALLIGYSWSEQLADLLPYAAMAAIMGVVVWGISDLPPNGAVLQTVIQIAAGILSYATLSWVSSVSSFCEARELVRGKLRLFRPAQS